VCPGRNAEGPLSSTSYASEKLQERECCLLEISLTFNNQRRIYCGGRDIHSLFFSGQLPRAKGAAVVRQNASDSLDLTHFLF
jgi:hypothetical protein